MSDGGGGGDEGGKGGSSKGGGGSSGFSDPFPTNSAATSSVSQAAATPGGSSAIPIIGTSGTFSASDGTSPTSYAPVSSGDISNPTTSIGSSAGIGAINAATPSSGGVGAAAPVGGGTSFTDLSGGAPFGAASGIDTGASGGPTTGGVTTPSTQLTPQQLGAPAAGASPAPPAAGGGGDKSILDSLGIKSPLGAAIGAAGLGYSVLQGQKAPAYSAQLQQQASQLNAQGQQLLSYLQSGTLPEGLKASLTQATSAAKAKVISNFAAQGLNTDPSQNSALAQELAAIDQQALISTAQIGQQLMTSGIAESGLSSDLYKTLANIDQTQTANIGKAISNFAASMSGGGGGINLKLAG